MAEQNSSCSGRKHDITQADLPLCCPLPGEVLWNAHPRVYLPIEKEGHIVCPYCSTEYRLVG